MFWLEEIHLLLIFNLASHLHACCISVDKAILVARRSVIIDVKCFENSKSHRKFNMIVNNGLKLFCGTWRSFGNTMIPYLRHKNSSLTRFQKILIFILEFLFKVNCDHEIFPFSSHIKSSLVSTRLSRIRDVVWEMVSVWTMSVI